jgi:hypothetical protein
MKSQSPALTQAALVSTARRKTKKVQRKLKEAEAELHSTNDALIKAVPLRPNPGIEKVVEKNLAVEEKVHDAAEELAVVKELLANAQPDGADGDRAAASDGSRGKTGQGVRSLIPHLASRRDTA